MAEPLLMPDLFPRLNALLQPVKPNPNEAHWRSMARGSIAPTPVTVSGKVEDKLSGALGALFGRPGQRLAKRAMAPINDWTPVGNAQGIQDGAQMMTRGDLASGALGAGLIGLNVLPFGGGLKRKAGRTLADLFKDTTGAIRAWHGSPHDFDRFSLDKIGTGEGAQAYGHGLYFAENKDVAKEYQRQLAGDGFATSSGKVFDPQTELQHMNVRTALRRANGDVDVAIARAHDLLTGASDATRPMLQSDLSLLSHLKQSGGLKPNTGRLYEVNINADPEQFLDWERPLSQQPGSVAAPFKQYGVPTTARGEDAYSRAIREITGDDGYWKIGARGPAAAATEALKGSLPGIRYLDQNSRGIGSGTSNYVVFDDKLIDILNKY